MIDRSDALRLDAAFLDAARRDAASRYIVYAGADALLASSLPIAPAAIRADEIGTLGADASQSVFLGLEDGAAGFAIDVSDRPLETRAPLLRLGRFVPLGPIQDPVAEQAWALLAQGRALLSWNANTKYCSTCGAPTSMKSAGYLRACSNPACGALHFPRSDPAVIVRVTHRDRCLLARQPAHRPGLRSILAGFVEPGESLEDAVRREVREEVGLGLAHLSYVGSQPWPFPMSLMVGFVAESAGSEIRLDGREIESADWMTREEVRHALADGTLLLASPKSIARRLIDDWLERTGPRAVPASDQAPSIS